MKFVEAGTPQVLIRGQRLQIARHQIRVQRTPCQARYAWRTTQYNVIQPHTLDALAGEGRKPVGKTRSRTQFTALQQRENAPALSELRTQLPRACLQIDRLRPIGLGGAQYADESRLPLLLCLRAFQLFLQVCHLSRAI